MEKRRSSALCEMEMQFAKLNMKGDLGLIQGKQILLENFPAPKIEINKLREISNISRTSPATVTTMPLIFIEQLFRERERERDKSPPNLISYSSLKRQAVKLSFIVREHLAEKTEYFFLERKMDARFFYFLSLLRQGGIPSRHRRDWEDARSLI
ncbi:MAG TPA: hypothetical protein DCW86_02455 [Actinobacteria bacterium]|nr:hypothetical protein [Actinomycetota bacterium]